MKMKRFVKIPALAALCIGMMACDPVTEIPQEKPTDQEKPSEEDTTATPDTPEKPDSSDITDGVPFKLKVYDISSVMATVEVEPLDKFAPYYMDILNDSDFQEATEHGFDDYMKWLLEHMSNTTGKSGKDVIDMISSYGNDGFILTTLTPETKYHAIAVGIGSNGMTTTEVISQEFTTLARIVSDNIFEISADDITPSTATVNVKTANDDPYILTIEPYSTTKDMSDENLATYIIQSNMAWGGLEQMTYSGDSSHEHTGKSGWEYEVIAFGYQDGAPTTGVTRYRFTMDEGNINATSCTFTFSHEFDNFNMHLSVTPSDNTVVYVTNVLATSELASLMKDGKSKEDALKENLENLIESLVKDLGARPQAVELISLMDQESFSLKFDYSTEYIQWAVPVDQNGYPTAPFSCSEPFTSPAEVVSDATINVGRYKVYNGTLLAGLYPDRFKNAKGYAVVDLTVQVNSDAESWWSYIAMGDLSAYKKETIIKNLQIAPTQPNAVQQYILAYWGVNTIFGIAQDADGLYGEPLLEVIHLSEDNVSPPTDIK